MSKPSVRDKLLESGLKTLHQQGFNGCSVQDITGTAGVPKGSFYNHFESKEALAMAALDVFWESGAGRRAILSDPNLEPIERLRLHFSKLTAALARMDFEPGCMIGNFSAEMPSNPSFQARLTEIYADWSREVEACIEEAKSLGQLKVELPSHVLAGFLVAAWEGAVLRSKAERDGAALKAFETVIFTGLMG